MKSIKSLGSANDLIDLLSKHDYCMFSISTGYSKSFIG